MSETSLPNLGEAKVKITADKSGMSGGLKDAEKEVKSAVDRIQANLMSLGKKLSVGISAPIMAIGATATASLESLNKATGTLRAGTGAVGQALRDLRKDFVATLSKSGADVQTLAADMAMLNTRTGATGEQLQMLTRQFQLLEKYTGEKPIREVTRIFGDWSVASKDQVGVMDLLFRANQKTGVSITTLSDQVVKYGAPLRQLGYTINEAIAQFAKWNVEGVNTEIVMAGVRMMLSRLASGGVKDLPAAFAAVTQAIKDAGSAGAANSLALEFFGAKAGPDMAAAIREGRFEFDGLVKDLVNGRDTLTGVAADTKTLSGAMAKFKNSVVGAFDPFTEQYQGIVKSFDKVLSAVGHGVQVVVGAFASMDGGAQAAIITMAGLAAAVGPVLISVAGMVKVWALFGAAIAAVSAPVLIAVAAIAAVIAVIAGLRGAWMAFQPEIRSGMQAIADWFSSGFDYIGTIFAGFMDTLRTIDAGWVDSLNSMGQNIWNFAGQVTKAAKEIIGSIIGIGMTSEAAARSHTVGPDWLKNWQIQMGQGWDAVKGLFQNKGFQGEDISQIFGPLDGAAGKFEALTSKMGANQKQAKQNQLTLEGLRDEMDATGAAASTLQDALSMRQGARPLEALRAELQKVQDMAAKFPNVIDKETMGLLTGKAWETFGKDGAIPIEQATAALKDMNPVFAETIRKINLLAMARNAWDAFKAGVKSAADAMDTLYKKASGDAAQGQSPLDTLKARLQEISAEAALFPALFNDQTIALLTGQAWQQSGLGNAQTDDPYGVARLNEDLTQATNTAQGLNGVMGRTMAAIRDGMSKTSNKKFLAESIDYFGRIGDAIAGLGSTLKSKLLNLIGGTVSTLSKMGGLVSELPGLFSSMATAGMSAAATIAVGMHIALNVIALIADAIAIVVSLFGGMGDGMEKVKHGWDRVLDEIGNKIDDWADQLTDTILTFVETGKFAFKDFVNSVLHDLLQIVIRYGILQPAIDFLGFAKGGVNIGGVSKFDRGGVTTRPMKFAMGAGLIGEGGGPGEAYLPLTRTKGGDLGVSVDGMPSGGNVQVTVNNYGPTPVSTSETVDPDGTRRIQLTVEAMVKRGIMRGAFDSAAGSAWRLQRRGASYG